jgi:diguanylate cyclase (GGDEF)-like protein
MPLGTFHIGAKQRFLVALERTDEAGMIIAAERIRAAVAAAVIPAEDGLANQVTVSIGVAAVALPASESALQTTIAAADQHLYRAKNNGRNRVEGS